MKHFILFFSFFLVTNLFSKEWYEEDDELEFSVEEVDYKKPFQAIVVDPNFSPFAGGYDILFFHHLLTKGEDYLLRNKNKDRPGAAWYRFFEIFLFWDLLDNMLSVTQHEVFGHGYRLRDEGENVQGYMVSPWAGWTRFDPNESTFKTGELMAVNIAGLEAEFILARLAKMNWIRSGRIDGRLSALYNQAQQSLFWYTIITHMGELKGDAVSGNDVEAYLNLLNLSYPNDQINIGTLTTWAAFNWLDPMTFYSYFSMFYYIATGKPWEFPMIPIKENIRYLPNARIGYAPYGPEAYFENFFSIDGNPLYVYFKGGKRSAGAGFSYNYFLENERVTLGANLDVWNQGKFITDATVEDIIEKRPIFRPELLEKQWGVAASLTSTVKIKSYMGLFVELGGKTQGYLPGYSLDKGVVARVGLVFQ
ncbi:MAG: hypothetical protein SNF33_01630 [Candidatus Algichlamydia australiensis]|nr:hypothetical protein [Chlamydiales bacterium]